VRSAIDPLVAVAVYLALLRVFGLPFTQDDLVICHGPI